MDHMTYVAKEAVRIGAIVLIQKTRRAAKVILPGVQADALMVEKLAAGVLDSGEYTVQNEETTQHG